MMLPTEQDIKKLELISPMLNSTFVEMKEFSKKSPNDKLNELKISMINRILKQIKELLNNESSIQFLDLLDDETLPSNSDTVLILAQYKSAVENFKSEYYGLDRLSREYRWYTRENP